VSRSGLAMRRRLRELERAREAVARAVAERKDPWYIEELRQRERALHDRALAAEDAYDEGSGPAPRGPAEPWPVKDPVRNR
jgi:hypothetical protein